MTNEEKIIKNELAIVEARLGLIWTEGVYSPS